MKKTQRKPAPQAKAAQTVEIARSFSYKLNMGNYESRDFFCSQKAECFIGDAEKISEAVHQFCKREVLRAVADYRAEVKAAEDRDRHAVNERKAELQNKRLDSVPRGGSGYGGQTA